MFNSNICLIVVQLVPLLVIFPLAIRYSPLALYFFALGMSIFVVYFLYLRNYLIHRRASLDLQVQGIQEKSNLLQVEIDQLQVSISSLEEKIILFSNLKGLTEQLSRCLSLEEVSRALSSQVSKLFGSDDTTILLYLFHSQTGELGISSSQKGRLRVNIKTKRGDSFDHWIAKSMQPLLIEDTKSDYRFDQDKISVEDTRTIRSLMSVPLVVGEKALGILRVDCPTPGQFTTEDLRFLTTVGDLGSVAIENAQLYEHLQELAVKDGLTDLYLKRYLLERLPEEMARHLRNKQTLSCLMIDLDKFKDYNDRFGHTAGDIVLRTLGMILVDFFNFPGALVCRYGGEEFCVLLPETPKSKAVEFAEGLRQKVAEQTILLRREKTHITVSIGVSSFPEDASIKEELINQADHALYQAKNSGRNKVCIVGKEGRK